MITLFIDTSSSDVSIAILKSNQILSSVNKTIPNEHSKYVVSFIDKLLKELSLTPDDIKRIMVVTGPGSFTGVRIGITIAKVYAYLKNIDVIGVSSLKMLSLSKKHEYCLSLIDARNNNYYMGLYDKDNNEVLPEQFIKKENLLPIIKEYNPTIVSNTNINIDDIKIQKQELNIEKIVFFYQNNEPTNPHLLVPNYLKLPQALEVKHD